MWRRTLLPIVAILTLVAGLARADDLALFNAAVADATTHHRVALGYLRTGEPERALAALAQMGEAWQSIGQRFGGKRPAAFAGNALYTSMLVDLPLRIVAARILIDMGRLERAANALEGIRETLSAMRRASRVEVLADCILDSNGAMRALDQSVASVADVTEPASAGMLSARSRAYAAALDRCAAIASGHNFRDPMFGSLIDAARTALARLAKAIETRDQDMLKAIMQELRSQDQQLAARFG